MESRHFAVSDKKSDEAIHRQEDISAINTLFKNKNTDETPVQEEVIACTSHDHGYKHFVPRIQPTKNERHVKIEYFLK